MKNHDISIRKAELKDSKKLSILYKQVYIKTYGVEGVSDEFANFITSQFSISRIESTIASSPNSIIVAEYKNNLVGILEIEFDKECPIDKIVSAELNKLYILEWFSRKGIGEKLLLEAEKIIRDKQSTKFWLWVLDSNTRAINFYKKHGFEQIGTAPFIMETNTYNNIVMLKKL